MVGHVVLLGDSIFDNAFYVPGGPSVLDHLRRILPSGWQATLVAVDGATASSVLRQIERIPADATHLVLSAGGNDALWAAGNVFQIEPKSIRDALDKLAQIRDEFATTYREVVSQLRRLQKPLTVCTVYDHIPGLAPAETAGLCLFNDIITRTAFAAGATLIDLRNVCREASDHAAVSPIEPSAAGGGKIARAIVDAVLGGDVGGRVIAS